MKTESKQYINSEEFALELLQFRKTGQASERLGQFFITLCDKILQHRNFSSYSRDLKDDMRSHALYMLMKYSRTCNPEERTPRECFNYCTTAVWHAYQNVLSKYYEDQNMIHAMMRAAQEAFEQQFGVTVNNKDRFELNDDL